MKLRQSRSFLLATKEGVLLFGGLEATMSQFGRSIDELEVDRLQILARGLHKHRFSKQKESLSGTNAASLDDDKIVLDCTVMRESSQRCDVLFSDISISGSVVLGSTSFTLSYSVNFLVQLSSVEESRLTGSGDSPGDSSGMPSSDTSDFSVTSVGFLLEMSNSPSFDDSSESFSLSYSQNVNDLILSEDLINSELLFKESSSEGDLISNRFSSVDLYFKDVVLFLSDVLDEVVLGVDDCSYSGAVFTDAVKLHLDFLGVLGRFSLVVAESFLLGVNPVLVESSESALVKVVSPNGSKSSKSTRGLNVSNKTDNLQGRGFNNSDCLNLLFLVEFSFGSVNISENVGHASLESSEGGKVSGLSAIVSGERPDLTMNLLSSLSGQETEMAFTGLTVFSVGHLSPI